VRDAEADGEVDEHLLDLSLSKAASWLVNPWWGDRREGGRQIDGEVRTDLTVV